MLCMNQTYRLIDYPNGARKVVGTAHVVSHSEHFEGVFGAAQVHARLTGRYIDVEIPRPGMSLGDQIAVVGPEGRIS